MLNADSRFLSAVQLPLPEAKLKGREPITALIESRLSVIRYHPPSSIPQVESRQPKSITTRPHFQTVITMHIHPATRTPCSTE
ncbi:hypothetical protein I7I48_10313 [Histoplasma ohiense]|nr:hypothetical protein I7I48_10313 [Histoplasma ohiense (nom. inval.)]